MNNQFIPNDFIIPKTLETDKFRLKIITINDAMKDYEAIMTSIKHLHNTKLFGSTRKWPPKNLTFEENLNGLKLHQKEVEQKSSFAYTVMSLDETRCLGCIYIHPSHNPKYDAIIMLWVRQSELENKLDEILFSTVKKWIKDKWPFTNPAYPGRDVDWSEFE